jgi:hypothetical protein
MKIIFCCILTVTALFLAFSHSIESPPRVGENHAIVFVGLLNLIWLLPYSIYEITKKNFHKLKNSLCLFCIVFFPFLALRFYHRSFESKKWKTELNLRRYYDNHPAHANGDMVDDIIESRMLIGLNLEEIESKLGQNYFTDEAYNNKLSTEKRLFYFYSRTHIFNGCDKLLVVLFDNKCVDATYAGCD